MQDSQSGGSAVGRSTEDLPRAIEESFKDAFASLCTACPGAVLRNEDDMIIYSSGAPSSPLNGVLAARFTPDNMAARTQEALSFFKERGLPMTFFVGPCCTPTELGAYLLRMGLVADWARPGMAIDLDTLDSAQLPNGLEIREVEDVESFDSCASIFAECFGTDVNMREWLYDLAMGYGFSSTRRWFLGILNGTPVSTSLLTLHKGIAGVYCIATLHEARGRGIGSALTREPLFLAKEMGHDFAVLQSSKQGLSVYKKLGFKEHCKIRAYVWSPK
jgi:ribosomal protein S18 acetylase RimI-like enzyme